MSECLQRTTVQYLSQILDLTVIVSRVLNAIADSKVSGLKRIEVREPLLVFLSSLQGITDPHLKYYASYAFQTLLCVLNDKSRWRATVRCATKVVKGISGLIGAFKGLRLDEFMSGLRAKKK